MKVENATVAAHGEAGGCVAESGVGLGRGAGKVKDVID